MAEPYTGGQGIHDFLKGEYGKSDWVTDSDYDSEWLVELAGRLCYMSFKNPRPGGNKAYIRHILESGHGSVLEHAVFSFIFTGVSRSLTHELIRHRAGFGYSELSQRYVDCSDVAFVCPPAILGAHESVREFWESKCQAAHDAYTTLMYALEEEAPDELSNTDKRKWARQAARSVLPECSESKIYVTGNARAWRHFLEMRGSRSADAEIRRLALKVFESLRDKSPNLFGDYEVKEAPGGFREITTPYRKV